MTRAKDVLPNINRTQAPETPRRDGMVPSARVYFSVQLITICAVVNLKCAPEKATCAVVICAVVKYLPK